MNTTNQIITEEIFQVKEPNEVYGLADLIYKKEAYEIISCCFEVHKILGKGFLEIIYKDALQHEFDLRKIQYARERTFEVHYKNKILQRHYNSDFIVFDKNVLEVKAQEDVIEKNFKQTINYLKEANLKLGLLVNFGENNLKFKRVVL